MFRIKICGVTSTGDARAAADAGADAIGLNFFRKSVRNVLPDSAREIALSLPTHVKKVGVFVNHSVEEIVHIVDYVGLDCVQLHGDEQAAINSQLPKAIPIVRAWQASETGVEALAVYWGLCQLTGRMPDALLVDAPSAEKYGGTGRSANWELIAAHRKIFSESPLILAGGLTPENVARAIAEVRPDGVDVASGVEKEPGRKRASLILQFVEAARDAFARL